MKYFTVDSRTTVDDLKYRYRELSKIMHPDKGGDNSEFIEMDEEFRAALNTLARSSNTTERSKAHQLLREILHSIIEDPNTIYRIVDLFTDKNKLDGIIQNVWGQTIDRLKREILKS